MNVQKTQSVLTTFLYLILLIGIVSTVITYTGSGISGSLPGLAGLLVGTVTCGGNYLLLHLMVKWLSSENYFMAIQSYVVRMLIYLAAAFLTVKIGMAAVVTFSAAIVAISLSLFYAYGIKGNRE